VPVAREDDVIHEHNKTTLGPNSFAVFVAAAWMEKHIAGSMPKGHRPKDNVGNSHRKQPIAAAIKEQACKAAKKTKIAAKKGKENIIPGSDNTQDDMPQTRLRRTATYI
jgi:hypothetical protein